MTFGGHWHVVSVFFHTVPCHKSDTFRISNTSAGDHPPESCAKGWPTSTMPGSVPVAAFAVNAQEQPMMEAEQQ